MNIEHQLQHHFDSRDAKLKHARVMLKVGSSLQEAAHAVGWTAKELDLALWQRLGRR